MSLEEASHFPFGSLSGAILSLSPSPPHLRGCSTLLGVLTHGELDNGRGLSRQKLFRHQHEADSGRTSSVSHDILGFGADGAIVNKPGHDGELDWPQICK